MTILEMAFSVVGALLTVLCVVLWFIVREVKSDARKALEDLAVFREYVAREHLTRDHFTEAMLGMDKKFDALFSEIRAVRKDVQDANSNFRDRLDAAFRNVGHAN